LWSSARKSDKLTDVRFHCHYRNKTKVVRAHKAVLIPDGGLKDSVLADLWAICSWANGEEQPGQKMHVSLPDTDPFVLEKMLECIYTGQTMATEAEEATIREMAKILGLCLPVVRSEAAPRAKRKGQSEKRKGNPEHMKGNKGNSKENVEYNGGSTLKKINPMLTKVNNGSGNTPAPVKRRMPDAERGPETSAARIDNKKMRPDEGSSSSEDVDEQALNMRKKEMPGGLTGTKVARRLDVSSDSENEEQTRGKKRTPPAKEDKGKKEERKAKDSEREDKKDSAKKDAGRVKKALSESSSSSKKVLPPPSSKEETARVLSESSSFVDSLKRCAPVRKPGPKSKTQVATSTSSLTPSTTESHVKRKQTEEKSEETPAKKAPAVADSTATSNGSSAMSTPTTARRAYKPGPKSSKRPGPKSKTMPVAATAAAATASSNSLSSSTTIFSTEETHICAECGAIFITRAALRDHPCPTLVATKAGDSKNGANGRRSRSSSSSSSTSSVYSVRSAKKNSAAKEKPKPLSGKSRAVSSDSEREDSPVAERKKKVTVKLKGGGDKDKSSINRESSSCFLVGMVFKCNFCEETFDKASNCKNHSLNHFKDELLEDLPKSKPYICPECNSLKRDKITLMRHYACTHKKISRYCSDADLLGRRVLGDNPKATGGSQKRRASSEAKVEVSSSDSEADVGKKKVVRPKFSDSDNSDGIEKSHEIGQKGPESARQ